MKALLTRHLKLHKEDRPFHCPTCEKTFKSLSNLRQHEGSHSDKKMYSCEICDSKFQHESSVKTHMQIHSGEKKFSCTICEKVTFNEFYMTRIYLKYEFGWARFTMCFFYFHIYRRLQKI